MINYWTISSQDKLGQLSIDLCYCPMICAHSIDEEWYRECYNNKSIATRLIHKHSVESNMQLFIKQDLKHVQSAFWCFVLWWSRLQFCNPSSKILYCFIFIQWIITHIQYLLVTACGTHSSCIWLVKDAVTLGVTVDGHHLWWDWSYLTILTCWRLTAMLDSTQLVQLWRVLSSWWMVVQYCLMSRLHHLHQQQSLLLLGCWRRRWFRRHEFMHHHLTPYEQR